MKKEAILLAAALLLAPAQAEDFSADPDCVPTRADHPGPYYVSGMPVSENINRFGKPGEPLEVSGFARSSAPGFAPVAGARVEVWQADGDGDYHPHGDGDRADHDDSDLDLRGTVLTDADGRFFFRAVVPGAEGFFSRPRHFHYRVTAAGFRELVTQHYVRENGTAPGGPCRSAEVVREGEVATFSAPDIFLQLEDSQ